MPDASHERLQEVFTAALDVPPDQRATFVASACGGDAALRARVLTLLAKAREDDTFLRLPLPVAELSAPALLREGDRVGPYELTRRIGDGGFGTVWEARQQQPVARQVALKILKLGMDTEQVVARFAQERQALAHLDHPGIARVLDAGATATGRPFFAMELVDGRPLVEVCDERRLPIRERLQLFAQICDAIQHAHGRGIIHRDLKPSNVLVFERDGTLHAKVIDFGIAKAIGTKLMAQSLHTEVQQVIGTLEYMSPEQASGAADIDVRTDVWSLGVVLYELLTGTTPFAVGRDSGDWHSALMERLRHGDPLRPSTELARAGARLADVAVQRRTTTQRLGALVRGELDWIVMKALERDRGRRYATAHELGADVRAHLAGEPVVAAPPSASYRVRKFVRRHRGLVAATAAVGLAMAAGLVAFAWQANVARAERDRAVVAGQQALQIKQLLVDALAQTDPTLGGMQGMRVVDAMARVAEQLDQGKLAEQPAVELELRRLLASIFQNMDEPMLGVPHAERAVQLAAASADGDDDRVVEAQQILATCYWLVRRGKEADAISSAALAMARRLHPAGDRELVEALTRGARHAERAGQSTRALELLQEALALAERLGMHDSTTMRDLLANLGFHEFTAGRGDRAEPYFAAALAIHRRVEPNNPRREIGMLVSHGTCRHLAGRRPEALPLLEEAVALAERVYPLGSSIVVYALTARGTLLRDLERVDDARRDFEAALAIARRLDTHNLSIVVENLGYLATKRGDHAAAEPCFAEALELVRRQHTGDHLSIARNMSQLALARLRLGRSDGVEQPLRDALAMTRRLYPGDHIEVAKALRQLGWAFWKLRRFAEAEPLFAENLALQRRLQPTANAQWVLALDDLAAARKGKGEFGAAAATYAEELAVLRQLPECPPGRAIDLLVSVLTLTCSDDRAAETRPLLDDVRATLRTVGGGDPAPFHSKLTDAAKALTKARHGSVARELLTVLVEWTVQRFPDGHLLTARSRAELGDLALGLDDRAGAIREYDAALAILRGRSDAPQDLVERVQQARQALVAPGAK